MQNAQSDLSKFQSLAAALQGAQGAFPEPGDSGISAALNKFFNAWSALASLRILIAMLGIAVLAAHAQDNYEIQVYSSEMDPPCTTTLALHSNFTAPGRNILGDGLVPTELASFLFSRFPQLGSIWVQ